MNVAGRRAVFLDRDGVLIRDVDNLVRRDDIDLLPGAPAALADLRRAGYALVVVSNQPVVARGLLSEPEVRLLQAALEAELLAAEPDARIDAFYFCPHHPHASLPAYRVACPCRKPRPGMLLQAAGDLGLDLARSIMVGDRPSDVAAGRRAGCLTILVASGRHDAPPIETPDGPLAARETRPDRICAGIAEAAAWVLAR